MTGAVFCGVCFFCTATVDQFFNQHFFNIDVKTEHADERKGLQKFLILCVSIYFGAPDKKEFQKIVSVLADRYGVKLSEEELLAEANKWELSHGGLSGRTAQQFIDYLLGKQ